MASATMGTAFRHIRDLFGPGSVVGLGDGQLLARYESDRDEAAFEALLSRHGPTVLATCRAVLENEQDVEDAFQATFLVLAKKARTVRGRDSLGGWLHRVARRASVQASIEARRRRRKEAEAATIAGDRAARLDPDLASLLHEEIDRLPEGQRLPVVLCDLEGLTYDQAAEQLRWTEPTLRNRLARGRQRLRARLTRRGVMAPAIGIMLVEQVAAAVPPSLMRLTLSAATGGTTSAGVSLLTHNLLRGMLMTKIKIASTAALMALALASAGLIAAAGRPDDPKPVVKPPVKAEGAREAQVLPKPGEVVEVRGRVVAPDGRPVPGATVRAAYFRPEGRPAPEATAGADGRFSIRLPDSGPRVGHWGRYPWLVASAPGFGVGWTERALRADRPGELVVKLVGEGPAIEATVVDLEGRAVAGARVEAARIWFVEDGNLAGWVAKARNGTVTSVGQGMDVLPLDGIARVAARTGADGKFRLTGLGPDRVADLLISGPSIATTQVSVMGRDDSEIHSPQRGMTGPTSFVVHPPRFEVAVAPTRPVEGVARDKDTGRPIAGLEIRASVAAGPYTTFRAEGVLARTDAEGRYRLDGLPRVGTYRLFVSGGPGLPYAAGMFQATVDSSGIGPVNVDLALKRVVLVRGKVVDKETGRPVRGTVFFMALADNPHANETPGYADYRDLQFARIEDDGRYEIAALPGPGLLAVMDLETRHRPASGLEGMKGYDASMNGVNTSSGPIPASGYNLFVAIDFDPKAASETVDLTLEPGRSATVEVVDDAGRPLGGTKVVGAGAGRRRMVDDVESSSFEVLALDPASPRRVTVTHEGRKLAGSILVKGDETGPITLKLRPWGAVVGRVVDDEGRPRKNIALMGGDQLGRRGMKATKPDEEGILPQDKFGGGIHLGDDGRFRIEGLVPGLKYGAYAIEVIKGQGDLFRDLVVEPGEVKDLGDLKVTPPKPKRE